MDHSPDLWLSIQEFSRSSLKEVLHFVPWSLIICENLDHTNEYFITECCQDICVPTFVLVKEVISFPHYPKLMRKAERQAIQVSHWRPNDIAMRYMKDSFNRTMLGELDYHLVHLAYSILGSLMPKNLQASKQ